MRRKRPCHPTETPLIGLYRVSRFYRNDRSALFDVTLDVCAGEFVYISGASGAGKSTLIKIIGALEMPDTGRVLFGGHDLCSLRSAAIALLRRSMGIVFQDFRLVPELSVEANIALPLEVAGISRAVVRDRVRETLDRVGLKGAINERAGDLSGGEKQRVAIARALAPAPELLLADEPTGNLDAYNANFVLDLFEAANEEGTTVLLATHDRMLMAARPHRSVLLDRGRIAGMTAGAAAGAARPASGLKITG